MSVRGPEPLSLRRKTERFRIRWVFEWLGVMGLAGVCRLMPLSWALAVGRKLGHLVYRFDRRHRLITLSNLRSAYPGEKEEMLQRTGVQCFQNLGESAVEFIRLSRLIGKERDRRITIEGMEHFYRAKDKGKGILFLTAHYGNWELLAVAFASLGYPVHVVARPLDNPFLNRWVNRRRSMTGNRVIDKNQSLRPVLSLLRKGESVGYLLDQNAGRSDGVFVRFFKRTASTAKGLALIALRHDLSVLPIFIIREGPGVHRIRLEKEMSLIRTGNMEEDILQNTQQFTHAIESAIRARPEQWLWVHQRWKTQPLPLKNVGGLRNILNE